MFLLLMVPAFLILLVGLAICRTGQRGACATFWACSLLVSNFSAYLAGSPYAPRIWLALALGAPMICIIFAVYSWFAQPRPDGESETTNSPPAMRRLKIAALGLALLPISAIVIAKFQMIGFDANVADCKQALARELITNNAANKRCVSRLTCSAPNGFSAPMVSTDSLVYTSNLVGQEVFLDAHLHAGAVVWECHVYPKIFGNSTCQGYDVGWH